MRNAKCRIIGFRCAKEVFLHSAFLILPLFRPTQDDIPIRGGVTGANEADGVRHSFFEFHVWLESHFDAAKRPREGGPGLAVVAFLELFCHENLAAFPVSSKLPRPLVTRLGHPSRARDRPFRLAAKKETPASATTSVLVMAHAAHQRREVRIHDAVEDHKII